MAGRYSDDNNRDRWQNEDRERSSWRSGGQGTSDREDERGFFERAGQELKSWFSDDDDRDDQRTRSSWDRDQNRGYGSAQSGRDRDRAYGSGSDARSSFGGMAQGGYGRFGSSERGQDRSYGPSRGAGEWRSMSDRDRSSFGDRSISRGRDHAQSWGEANRGPSNWDRGTDDGSYGYSSGMSGTLGGFGNQTSFGSGQDDHYRSWRDRQLAELDRDYDDYCREREQQFHSDFDSWRRSRTSQSPSATTNASSGGTASNAGVGTTTGSVTGTAGTGSASGSATGTGGAIQVDTTGSTETAGAGTGGGSGRSGSRTRS
jgi:hypothetical protein